VKNWWKAIGTVEKLHVVSWYEKGKHVVGIFCNVRLAYSSIHTICDKANRLKEGAKSGIKVFVCVARVPQSYPNELYQKLWIWVWHSYSIINK
jgi:hypothetical protein